MSANLSFTSTDGAARIGCQLSFLRPSQRAVKSMAYCLITKDGAATIRTATLQLVPCYTKAARWPWL